MSRPGEQQRGTLAKGSWSKDHDAIWLMSCPWCGRSPGQRCLSGKGREVAVHEKRINAWKWERRKAMEAKP